MLKVLTFGTFFCQVGNMKFFELLICGLVLKKIARIFAAPQT